MTSKLRTLLPVVLLTIMPGTTGLAHADLITNGYLYVADYGKSVLDRYQYAFDETLGTITSVSPYGIGGNTTDAYFLGSASNPIKEGLQGTSNDLIAVVGAHGNTQTTLERFNLDGSLIGTIPVDFSAYNGGNVGIGNVAITADGKYMYAPLETANAIVKIDLTNGNIVASYSFAAVHDVAIAANGDIYASNYNGATPEVIRLNSSLVFQQNLVTALPNGVSGSFHPTGIAVAADGSIYVDNNTKTETDSVLHYSFTENAGILTPIYDPSTSYIGSNTNNALDFSFGNNIGPDGNVYVADLGGGGSGNFGVAAGYIDGIDAFDPTTGTVSQFIAGYTEKNGPLGSSGLSAPKYLQFDTNFINAPDAGLVPEPSTTVLLVAGMAGIAALKRAKYWNR